METNGHATTYRSWKRFASTVVAFAVIIGLAIFAVQDSSNSAVTMPPSGTVVVTGFGQLSAANPSSEPTSVVLSDAQALALRSAVAALPRLSITPRVLLCMEESTVITIAVGRLQGGVMSTSWLATAELCPAPGILHATKGEQPWGVRYCALRSLVSSFFPKGTAAGTRSVFKLCTTMNNP
jgi:hypothetical protein